MKELYWKFHLGSQVITLVVQYQNVLQENQFRKKTIFDFLEPYEKGQALILKHHLKLIEKLYGKKLTRECVTMVQSISKELIGFDLASTLENILSTKAKKLN